MKNILTGLIICGLTLLNTKAEAKVFFQKSDAFLKLWVSEGKVDYQGIQNHLEAAEELYLSIGQMDIGKTNATEQKAFYINAYNLIVIYQISKYYPLNSPLDHSGFFDQIKHEVAGESMTLNHLEIMKIMMPYRDPRIHFALSSAAISCPPIANFAYLPQQLDTQLDQRTRLNLNDNRFVKVDPQSKKVLISKMFAWYKNDFVFHGQRVREFINQYRNKTLPADYAIDYNEYYWVLNVKEVVGR